MTDNQNAKTEIVEKICDYIRTNAAEDLSLSALESRFGISRYYLQKTFKEIMGITPRKYVEECRINLLKHNLREGVPIPAAIYKSGYNSQSWLYNGATSKLGMPASSYRKGGEGAKIRYDIIQSKLGFLVIAETDSGICALSIGDSEKILVDSLEREFPKAEIARSDEMKESGKAVLEYLEGKELDLPLDVQGTEFQKRVWAAIKTIPYGETKSYSEIAEMIGKPEAHRAVANACGANPVPLIVPCHRVVRKDGSLGGYGLGVDKKEFLLKMEKHS